MPQEKQLYMMLIFVFRICLSLLSSSLKKGGTWPKHQSLKKTLLVNFFRASKSKATKALQVLVLHSKNLDDGDVFYDSESIEVDEVFDKALSPV
jgi:hypothetical protein